MSDPETKLRNCFSAAFPALPQDRITGASVETVPQWDSVAYLTLVEMIQQEFQIRIDDQELERLTSFSAWLERVQQRPDRMM